MRSGPKFARYDWSSSISYRYNWHHNASLKIQLHKSLLFPNYRITILRWDVSSLCEKLKKLSLKSLPVPFPIFASPPCSKGNSRRVGYQDLWIHTMQVTHNALQNRWSFELQSHRQVQWMKSPLCHFHASTTFHFSLNEAGKTYFKMADRQHSNRIGRDKFWIFNGDLSEIVKMRYAQLVMGPAGSGKVGSLLQTFAFSRLVSSCLL